MPDIFGNKERKGNSGRIPDKKAETYTKYENRRYTCPPELYARLSKYCDDEERAYSWVIQKALDDWLSKRGY